MITKFLGMELNKSGSTPIETYNGIDVKREDLCAPEGAPPFSKIRGLVPYLERLKKHGYSGVGYTETAVSMAGWGVVWACKKLGLRAVIFDPLYKSPPPILEFHRQQWQKFDNVEIISIKAGMASVNWYISRKLLQGQYGNQYKLLPLGLPLVDSVEATAQETQKVDWGQYRSVVVNVGSGTMAAGVWKGIDKGFGIIYGVMGRTGSKGRKLKTIEKKAERSNSGLFRADWEMQLIDPGWGYSQKCNHPCPFLCHPYYDRKAWKWLQENIDSIPKPILFWNIGH